MSIVGRQFEKAIDKGQASIKENLKKLEELMLTIIENENEIITQQKEICDKLGIESNVEK